MILELLSELDNLNLPKDEYAIFGSAALVVRGIKENATDLDVIVTKELWNKLASQYQINTAIFNGQRGSFINIGNLDFITNIIGFTDEERDKLIADAEIIKGYRFASLFDIIKWKKILSRDKDLKDIKLIEDYLVKEKY